MAHWEKAGKLSEFRNGCQWQVEIQNRPVALFKYENNFYAIRNSCLHQGFPLSEGNVKKYMVECPLHGWVFDIRDGKCLSTENRFTDTYDVRIIGDNLEIKLPDKYPAE